MKAHCILYGLTRLVLTLVLVWTVAACTETPVEPEREPDTLGTSTQISPKQASVRLPELDHDLKVVDSFYMDAITFTPGSVTLWPFSSTIPVEVSVRGTALRLVGGDLDVNLEVPPGLSVNGAGSGVDQIVTIPATSNRTTFRLQGVGVGGQTLTLRGTAGSAYRPGQMSVRIESLKLADLFAELDVEISVKEQEPWWTLEMTPDNASLQVCDVLPVTVERSDIGWNVFDLDVTLNVPAGLSVHGSTIQPGGSGSQTLTIPAGQKTGRFEVRAEAGSAQPYLLTASAAAYRPDDVQIQVAVPSLSLTPNQETMLVGETKAVTLARSAGSCAALPVQISAATGLGIAGGPSGQALTVTIPASQSNTSVNLCAFSSGGSPYTVSASAVAYNGAQMAVQVPTPTLDLQVVGSSERVVHWGQSATYTLEVSGQNWFQQPIELEVHGTLPDGVSDSFSPAQVTLTPAQPSQQVTLTLTTIEGETELYSQNNNRPHDIRVRAKPGGSSSPSDTETLKLSVLRTNGTFSAFNMGTSTNNHPSGVTGEVTNGTLNFRYNGRTDGPYHPFLGFGISSAGRVSVVNTTSPNAQVSQTKFVNLLFPQRGFGATIWSSQNSLAGYSAGWFYSPDNSVLLVAARDCNWASAHNTVCYASNVPYVVTLIDALGGAIGGNRGIGQSTLSGSAIRIESSGTTQTVVLTKANGQTVTWTLSP